jgi:hypothetical protein
MRVTSLKLTNIRAIEAAEFRFQPGFNLIVGVNGVGKTTVLEALGVELSAIVRHANSLKAKSGAFLGGDIRESARALTAECSVEIGEGEYSYLIHKARSSGEGHAAKAGMPREQTIDTPDRAEFTGSPPASSPKPPLGGRPLGVFFSTRRAVTSTVRPSKAAAGGGLEAACSQAFAHRELRLSEFAEWMRAREALERESPAAGRILHAFDGATRQFLPSYHGIRAIDDSSPRLVIDRGELATIPVDQLSDRERAGLREAIQWADRWMSLNWSPDSKLTDSQRESARVAAKASIIADALARFLPNCANLRPADAEPAGQMIDVKPTTLEVAQLSDGERGMLALVLDLTRRLAQANPEMSDPTTEAQAVVLVDEIDLHLHPKWQRQIVGNLTAVFPRCQFIATTHSPQVVAAVEPEQVLLLTASEVVHPDRTLGMDSNWILRHLMEADDRPADAAVAIRTVEELIKKGSFTKARLAIAKEVEEGLDLPEWSVLEARMARLDGLGR